MLATLPAKTLVYRSDHALAPRGPFISSIRSRSRALIACCRLGAYEVITDEEMIEGLSFASFRRVATMIMVPGAAPRDIVDGNDLDQFGRLSDAQRVDASAPHELTSRSISTSIAAWQPRRRPDIRRVLADVETKAKLLRDHQSEVEIQLMRRRRLHGPKPRPRRAMC